MPLWVTRKLLAEVVSIADGELKRLGFRKTSGVYTYEFNDDALGWLGLNTIAQRSDGSVGINPVVGVVSVPVETMLQELTSTKEPRLSPTLSTSIGYLMPDARYQEWLFEPPPFDYQAEAKKMVSSVERYGIPFMQSNALLGEIIGDLKQVRFTSKDSVHYRLPIAYALSREMELANAYVREHVQEITNRNDLDAQSYRAFASEFLNRFSYSGESC